MAENIEKYINFERLDKEGNTEFELVGVVRFEVTKCESNDDQNEKNKSQLQNVHVTVKKLQQPPHFAVDINEEKQKIGYISFDTIFLKNVQNLHICLVVAIEYCKVSAYPMKIVAELVNVRDPSRNYTKEVNVLYSVEALRSVLEFPISWQEAIPKNYVDAQGKLSFHFYIKHTVDEDINKEKRLTLAQIMERKSACFEYKILDLPCKE